MKSKLIKTIQDLSGIVSVEPFHTSPDEPDELCCIITFEAENLRLSPDEVAIRNYNAQLRRKTITDKTVKLDFIYKAIEELKELETAIINDDEENEKEELSDCSLIWDSYALNYGIDLQKEKELKMIYNELRND